MKVALIILQRGGTYCNTCYLIRLNPADILRYVDTGTCDYCGAIYEDGVYIPNPPPKGN